MESLLLVVVMVAVLVTPSVISALKGKYWLALLGVVGLTFFALIGALRPAKPSSCWARRFYSDAKLADMRASGH